MMDQIQHFLNVRNVLHDHRANHPERIIRDRSNPLELFEDKEFILRFRFNKDNVYYLINLLRNDLQPLTRRNKAIPPYLQVLIALQFYATGGFQITVGDLIRVHQSTVCRIVKRVSVPLARKKNRFIKFPQGRNVQVAMQTFHDIAAFPQVVSSIDCTHVRISNPGGEDALRFINRKGYHSINCQMTCTADLCFTSVVARWPGSAHDSRIFRESNLCTKFEQGQLEGLLLGDAGYPLLAFLMTPVNNPVTEPQRRYNRAHVLTRNTIERAFGVFKRRFAALHFGLRLKMETVFAVIVAVSVLHNIAIFRNDIIENMNVPENIDEQNEDLPNNNQVNIRGNLVRQRIIQSFT